MSEVDDDGLALLGGQSQRAVVVIAPDDVLLGLAIGLSTAVAAEVMRAGGPRVAAAGAAVQRRVREQGRRHGRRVSGGTDGRAQAEQCWDTYVGEGERARRQARRHGIQDRRGRAGNLSVADSCMWRWPGEPPATN